MPAEGPTVQIEFVSRVAEIDGCLWRDCFPAPLEGRFWYQALEDSGLGDQFMFCYALIRKNSQPVGIAPCFLHDVPITLVAPRPVAWVLRQLARVIPRVGYQRTLFVGSPCADEGTVGLVPGLKLSDIVVELSEAVGQRARALKAPMIVFKDFPQVDLPVLKTLRGFFPSVSYPGTITTLPAPGKDAYYRSLAHTQRHNLLKKFRRSRVTLPLVASAVQHPSDAELAEVFGLFQQTYERGITKFERLDRRFFERIRGEPTAHFILLRDSADSALAAFMLVFCLGGRVVNKFIGLDYRRGEKAYLYFRLFDAAVDFAYACHATELASGQTGYRAKFDLGHRLVPLFNVARHANPLIHAIFRAVGTRITWQTLDEDLAVYLRAHPEVNVPSATP